MNLALILGQNSESLKPKLVSVKDNLNIECFTDLQNFIKGAVKRDLVFDRIIILSTLANNDAYIDDLYKYWNNYSRQSEVILLCRKELDDDLARGFLSRFCSTSVTSMSVTSTTLHTLSEAVTLPVLKLSEMYGIPDYLSVEVEKDSYEDSTSVKESEVQSVQEVASSNMESKSKEKRNLFGALFNRKKKDSPSENTVISNIKEKLLSNDNTSEDYQSYTEEYYSDNQHLDVTEEVYYNDDYDDFTTEDNNYSDNDMQSFSEDNYENYDENCSYSSFSDGNDFEEEFNYNDGDSHCYNQDTSQDSTEDDFNFENSRGMQDFSDEVVDEDFGNLTYTETISGEDTFTQVDIPVEEVEDVDGDLSVGTAEEEYRKKTEQPKVIKETVVKEVIKSVKTSSVLENIYRGNVSKLILVTGDRGSGVTTTAWSLAMHFAQKVPVLYFDCDIVNHGLMNYIDYFEFKNYEFSHTQGVKLCRNSQALNSCICKWDTNIDLLTSDFGVEISDDELITAQDVVAENLSKYGVVIVDCPVSKLHCVQDLILTGNIVLCVEESKRGFMNVLTGLDNSELPLRYKRSMVNKGTLVRTKANKKNDYKRVMKYIGNIVDLEDCNWLGMTTIEFTGKVTNDLLTEILEG